MSNCTIANLFSNRNESFAPSFYFSTFYISIFFLPLFQQEQRQRMVNVSDKRATGIVFMSLSTAQYSYVGNLFLTIPKWDQFYTTKPRHKQEWYHCLHSQFQKCGSCADVRYVTKISRRAPKHVFFSLFFPQLCNLKRSILFTMHYNTKPNHFKQIYFKEGNKENNKTLTYSMLLR